MMELDGQEVKDDVIEGTDVKPQFQMGLTPFGKIGINVTDANGTIAGYVIESPTEAWEIAGHLLAIATMMVQTFYAMAAQEKEMMQKIMADPTGNQVWTPGDK